MKFHKKYMKTYKTISFDVEILAEYEKRNLNLNEIINKLLAEKLAFIQIKEEKANKEENKLSQET